MAEGSGFDVSKMSLASKILGVAGIVYLVVLFLPWNQVCVGEIIGISTGICASVNGLHGLGFLNLILVVLVVGMEVAMLTGTEINVSTPQQRAMIGAGIAWAITALTVLKVLLVDNEFIAWGAWLGLIVSLVIAYGGFLRFQESKAMGGAAPPPPDQPAS